jgi:hypothetical protein
MALTVTKEGTQLVIKIDMQDPKPSKSTGKTMIVASTGGNVPTTLQHNGKTIMLGLTAYYKP